MNRLVDVLDETLPDKLFWDKVFEKWDMLFGLLQEIKIESYKGPSMSIDDTEYRWVTDRIRILEQ